MKIISIFSIVFLMNSVLYAADSMAVIQKQNGTVVLINEDSSSNKLDAIIDAFESGDTVDELSSGAHISVECRRTAGAKSCTFKFRSSPDVEVEGKDTYVYTEDIKGKKLAIETFENENGDRFMFWVDQFQLAAESNKN